MHIRGWGGHDDEYHQSFSPMNPWNPDNKNARSAEARSQQRAMRTGRGFQSPPRYPVDQSPLHPGAESMQSWTQPTPEPMVQGREGGWVMLFNAGQPNEGIYSSTHEQGSQVLAFECMEDANSFAQLLVTKNFDLATPQHWSAARLTQFCSQAGLEVSIVPHGTVPAPPTNTYEQQLGDPERKYGAARSYKVNEYGQWLDKLFLIPNSCGDDDCILR